MTASFPWQQVTCRKCKRTYTCTPEDDYFNADCVTSGVCFACLLTEGGSQPGNHAGHGDRPDWGRDRPPGLVTQARRCTVNHRHPYATREEAEARLTPGGTVRHCPCNGGSWHVYPPKPAPSPLRARRDTGPDAKTRKAVYVRDNHACVCCGTPVLGRPHSVGHRKRRSQGGDNSLPNLLTFLGLGINPLDPDDHHARIDSRRDPEDEAKGYTVRSYNDPALISVMLFSEHQSGMTLWPTDDGHWSAEPPEGAVAA